MQPPLAEAKKSSIDYSQLPEEVAAEMKAMEEFFAWQELAEELGSALGLDIKGWEELLSLVKATTGGGQLYPSGPGLVPNKEVDARYKELRELHDAKEQLTSMIVTEAIKSPFGPAVAGQSLDELTPLTLKQLLTLGGIRAGSYLRLTVVQPALMFACPVTVVADDDGRRVLLYCYNTGACTAEDARSLFPAGARIALKNPFLKHFHDLWLGLRVDSPGTIARLDLLPLPPGHRLLVLGDGDFSFSAALAKGQRDMTFARPQQVTGECPLNMQPEVSPAPLFRLPEASPALLRRP